MSSLPEWGSRVGGGLAGEAGGAAAVKATTTATGSENKFKIRDEIRQMATEAAKCGNPVLWKDLRKKARQVLGEFDARVGALPRGKIVQRPVVKKLWRAGRAIEDGEEWTEETRAYCERCYDDKDETAEVHAERIRDQRRRGDSGRRVEITPTESFEHAGK